MSSTKIATMLCTSFILVLSLAYNFLLVFGCGYEVFEKGHSGWWFLLAYCMAITRSSDIDPEKE